MQQTKPVSQALEQIELFFSDLYADRPDAHFGGNGYLCRNTRTPKSEWPYPCIMVVFGEAPYDLDDANGYIIDDWGRPPDFVLEVASESAGTAHYTTKRDQYEAFKVPEYFRFDKTGGKYHDAALAGDRLVEGVYVPIPVERHADGSLRCYSEGLGTYLCWVDGNARIWDPAREEYLPYTVEAVAAYREAVAAYREAVEARRLAEIERDTARVEADTARIAAQTARVEAKNRPLRERLRRSGQTE